MTTSDDGSTRLTFSHNDWNMEQKKSTIQDIANKARVSKSTVSRVLNDTTPVKEEKRIAVEEAIKSLNFQPNLFARGLASGQSMTIGILTQDLGSPFYNSVTQGIIQRLNSSKYSPIFVDGQWQEEVGAAGIQTLLGRQVDGVIVIGGNLAVDVLQELKSRAPILIVAKKVEAMPTDCIYIDNVQAGYEATKYLIEQGHRRILHIMGIESHQDAIGRYGGYQKALAEFSIELDEKLVVEGNFDCQSGIDAIEPILEADIKFSAVFCANDLMAYGARLALFRRGIEVPTDVSLIGFDDQSLASFTTPPMTSMHQPAEEMGITAADSLLQRIENNKEIPIDIDKLNLKASLMIRESVAKI
jgi:LacI family transcriptional regulator